VGGAGRERRADVQAVYGDAPCACSLC
jgi:hypothetical protein